MSEKSYVGMMNCWVCGEGAEILLNKTLRPTLERNMGSTPNTFCSKCQSLSKDNDGIWVISVKDDEEPTEGEIFNPFRTGGLVLIKKSALKELFQNTLDANTAQNFIDMVDRNIYFFLADQVYDLYQIPRNQDINNLEDPTDEATDE
jgi:hypothetical protein